MSQPHAVDRYRTETDRAREITHRRPRRRRPLLLLLALLPTVAAAQIKVWNRAPGDYGVKPRPTPDDSRIIDLAGLKQQTAERLDVQYGRSQRYRGVPLAALLAAAPPDPRRDTAILHFANGMRVPVPRVGPPDAFVALAVEREGRWAEAFPASKDGRSFTGNKIVWSQRLGDGFVPWPHVDSLTGVEWVDRKAYAAQFDVKVYPGHLGHEVFMQVCQSCHGAQLQGAKYGIDFLLTPSSGARQDEVDLHYHLMYPGSTTPGGKMPAMAAAKRGDAVKILAWIKALRREGLKPYQP